MMVLVWPMARPKPATGETPRWVSGLDQARAAMEEGEAARAEELLESLEAEVRRAGSRDALVAYLVLRANASWREPEVAMRLLEEAVRLDPSRESIWLLLAQAKYLCHRYDEALDVLEAHRSAQTPGLTLLEVRILRALGRVGEAYGAVLEGLDRWPQEPRLVAEQARLLLGLGASAEAVLEPCVSSGRCWSREHVLMLARSRLMESRYEDAAALLETFSAFSANLDGSLANATTDPDLLVLLAAAYAGLGAKARAGALLEAAGHEEPSRYLEAAAMYLAAGRWWDALRANSKARAGKAKEVQSLRILLAAGWRQQALDAWPGSLGSGDLDADLALHLAAAFDEAGLPVPDGLAHPTTGDWSRSGPSPTLRLLGGGEQPRHTGGRGSRPRSSSGR